MILNSVNSKITIDFENEKQAKLIYDSILLEFETAPDYRSNMNIELCSSKLIVKINSKDATSFRASINSAIKWIMLSLEINNLVD